jgi:NAD(P)-dependent dehydrogenase (short-subunit alcohol dehydrogenase family)
METGTTMEAGRKTALVTGGARRVGRAIVEDLAAHGWAVAIHHGTSATEAAVLAAGIRRAGGRASVVAGDLAAVGAVGDIVAAACAAVGPLVLLVNNAAIYEKDVPGSLDYDLWQRQLAINLSAPVFLAEAFAAQLPEGEEGNIVNLLDPRVFRPEPDYFSYQISKSAFLAATLALARAYAPRIRVNAIAPGPVVPSVHTTEERYAKRINELPLLRAPSLADFGRTVRYFVENTSVTGEVIALDSGQHLA